MALPSTSKRASLGLSLAALAVAGAEALAQETPEQAEARLRSLRDDIAAHTRQLEALKQQMAEQEARLEEIRRALGLDKPASATAAATSPPRQQAASQAPSVPVGQAPGESRPMPVATIFEQPGILTPKGAAVLEPSLQYSYSSSSRVALVGYTIIPAILIGVVDVREVKRSTFIGTLTGRYGITNRFEIEARLPYVHRSDTSVGREILQGAASSTVFDASGSGIGDIEFTGRYQLNDGGIDRPYYVASLRLKTRTGKDPFEVMTATDVVGLRDGVQTELPRGSGFYGLQPALTVLYPSDPVVLFGTISYLHSIARNNVVRQTSTGPELLGRIQPGGIFGFNFGMGLALNEKSSFSIGYDHSIIGKTRQNGIPPPDSVRLQLGTLLLGYAYRLDSKRTFNVSLGAGVTRDTPDMTLTVRMPVSF